ncbi:hypothetical protein WJX74_006396 [Apatococcus lobatus]|uniref:Uncharacterized protein n=2 Tax=Apatococcus TaxID=904362 RepID=A0AAW1RNI2_9CHLO
MHIDGSMVKNSRKQLESGEPISSVSVSPAAGFQMSTFTFSFPEGIGKPGDHGNISASLRLLEGETGPWKEVHGLLQLLFQNNAEMFQQVSRNSSQNLQIITEICAKACSGIHSEAEKLSVNLKKQLEDAENNSQEYINRYKRLKLALAEEEDAHAATKDRMRKQEVYYMNRIDCIQNDKPCPMEWSGDRKQQQGD